MHHTFERPVRLAVFFEQEISVGGAYQQSVNAALLVRRLAPDLCVPVFVVAEQGSVRALAHYGVPAICFPLSNLQRWLLRARSTVTSGNALALVQRVTGENRLDRFLTEHQVDLIYFTSPSRLARCTERFNYIYTLWDLCHRDQVEFPEVYAGREFERREQDFWCCLPKAAAIMVDSELSRENVVRRFGVDPSRLHVLPFSPSQSVQAEDHQEAVPIDVQAKYGLEHPYVYYPAQYWPHKNHVYLLRGLKRLEEKHGVILSAICSGSDMGNREYLEGVASALGIADRVRFTGFLPNEEIPTLYKQSVALVMPSYFGPTNLPPLEAFRLGVPVLYSDLEGLRDQVGNAALLLDLSTPDSLADHLHSLLTQPELRGTLIAEGTVRLARYSDTDRLAVLTHVLRNFQQRMVCHSPA